MLNICFSAAAFVAFLQGAALAYSMYTVQKLLTSRRAVFAAFWPSEAAALFVALGRMQLQQHLREQK